MTVGPKGAGPMPRMDTSFVEVALPLPMEKLFTYRIKGPAPAAGTRAMVPFRNRVEVGWILGPGSVVPRVRDVLAVLEPVPSVGPELLDLARWIADYYVAPLGVVLKTMLPASMVDRSRDRLLARGDVPQPMALTAGEARILEALADAADGRSSTAVRRAVGKQGFWTHVRGLVEKGLVEHSTAPPRLPTPKTRAVVHGTRSIGSLADLDAVFGAARRQRELFETLELAGGSRSLQALLENGFSRSVVKGLVDKGLAEIREEVVIRDPFSDQAREPGPSLTPTADQKTIVERLTGALDGGGTFLLHGVTGSGKTLVYVELLRRVLARGQGAIVLVPEIALTPQTVSRFRAGFGDQVAVLHSGLSEGERFDAWRQLKSGVRRVAIGARSAVFAPVEGLGAVIVDEEHDGSYKQSEAPRYHGRDVAVVRASRAGAVCVLGSATPSLESWVNARSGKYGLLSLPDRVGGGVLPDVHIADLRKPKRSGQEPGAAAGPGKGTGAEPSPRILSPQLVDALRLRLDRREQTILLLNRRGYASFALCEECGDVTACTQCSVSLTYHRGRREMVCHHCGHTEPPPERCRRCGGTDISFRGLGTEQVERVVVETLPGARVARMDVDTTGGKWSHHEILGRVRDGTVDILLGTQMIAKGLDFPRVTLVGVINADVGLHLPDFRSAERTFQLLAQVAGRAGRGVLGGEVVIQTYVPDHYVVRAAVGHDYRGFVDRELKARVDPPYPPHVRMGRVLLSSPVQSEALGAAEALGRWLSRTGVADPEVLGPAPAPIERLHGRFRWHVLLRGSARAVGRTLRHVASAFEHRGSDVRVSLDRDPQHLL